MPHSKTPGGQQASAKFLKREEQAHGHPPADAPVLKDSGDSNVGIDNNATNVPGEKALSGVKVGDERDNPGQAQTNASRG